MRASGSATSPLSTPATTCTGSTRTAEHAIDLSRGVRLYVGLEAIGAADEKGVRTVMVRVNGQLRPVFVKDERITVTAVNRRESRSHGGRPDRSAVLRHRHREGR